jgi:hypothetical protein
MLASYLILSGSSYDEALKTIQNANPNAELREAQTTFLRELAEDSKLL